MNKETGGNAQVGSLAKIKDKVCVVIKTDSIEEAELISKKYNGIKLRDSYTNEKFRVRVSLKIFRVERNNVM